MPESYNQDNLLREMAKDLMMQMQLKMLRKEPLIEKEELEMKSKAQVLVLE